MNLFKFFSFSSLAHNERKQADAALCGRSMVEMLGVLAIIGVLSVGAIAGYSKAMFKYKLNKQAEAINMLINYGLQYIGQSGKLEYTVGETTYYEKIFEKLGLLPDGIRYNASPSASGLRDHFNNQLSLYYTSAVNDGVISNFGGLVLAFDASDQGAEICRNVVNVARENSANLYEVQTYVYQDKNHTSYGHIFGDQYCGGTKKCLRDLSLNDIDALCHVCDGTLCNLYILWK